MNDKVWLLVDLDHSFCLGRKRERREGVDTLGHFAQLMFTLASIEGRFELVFVTDRGGAQLAPLDFVMHASRYHAGESGAVAYDAKAHTMLFSPEYKTNIESVPGIRSLIRRKYPQIAIEPGVLSSVRVERYDPKQDLQNAIDILQREADTHGFWECEDHGDCISLKPPGIDKAKALDFLEKLYVEAGNPIIYERALWIGNSLPDIPGAERVIQRGGKAAAVGNASEEYRRFIETNGWYVAEKGYTEGSVEILQRFIREMGLL
jgi:hydroxymethylpyrimidine pyrophosphatase-like HAD family hydrolase